MRAKSSQASKSQNLTAVFFNINRQYAIRKHKFDICKSAGWHDVTKKINNWIPIADCQKYIAHFA